MSGPSQRATHLPEALTSSTMNFQNSERYYNSGGDEDIILKRIYTGYTVVLERIYTGYTVPAHGRGVGNR